MHRYLIIISALVLLLGSCGQKKPVKQAYTDMEQKISTRASYLNIRDFSQDSLGYVWIATLHGLNRYNGYEYFQYFHDASDSASIDNDMVFALLRDSRHRLWVGTLTGTNRYDFLTNRFLHYYNSPKYNANVYSFFEDHKKNIWVATHAGPGLVDTTARKVTFPFSDQCIVRAFWEDDFQRLWMGTNIGIAECRNNTSWDYFPLPGNRQVTSAVYKDPNATWWLGTNSGIVCFDPVSRSFKKLPAACLESPEISKTQINFITEINRSRLLIGTETKGLYQYDMLSQTLQHNEPWRLNNFNSNELLSNYVDRQGNVWIGSYDKGFTVWNKSLEYFNYDQQLSNIVRDKFVTRIVEDRFGNLWIGTRYNGLFHYSGTGKITVYDSRNSNLFNESDGPIESLFIDSGNRIWIGLAGQLIIGSVTREGAISVLDRKKIEQVRTVKEDKDGNIWIGSWNGFIKIEISKGVLKKVSNYYRSNVPDLCILESGDILFSSYEEGIFRLNKGDTIPQKVQIDGKASPVAQACVTLFEDSQQRIWMGSYGSGMLFWKKGEFHVFTKNEGLPSNNILCFEEDPNSNIWMSTSSGISNLNLSDTLFTNYSISDGTLGNQYHEKGGLKSSDGRIFFTGNHGLTFFNPLVVVANSFDPVIRLEDLKIVNQSTQPLSVKVLPRSLAYLDNVTLSHRQTNFSIDYTGIDFIAPDKLTYAYKLEGFDENWNYTGNFRRATYSNLSAGGYTFYVKAINSNGVESRIPARIHITIEPAPWATWWARGLYILTFIFLSYSLFRLIFKAKLNRRLLEIEHNEREREKEISEMKTNFFTNISHELRTPLTLISAPLEQLSSSGNLSEPNMKLLNTVSRNVQSMLRLINQLLDFRKMESGILALQVQKEDIIQHLKNILEVFEYPARKKQIELVFSPHSESQVLLVDIDKLEKILHNLLSNALKHTPDNGSVKLATREISGVEAYKRYPGMPLASDSIYLELTVSDSGPGIPADKIGELFVRYRRINSFSGLKPDYSGSGIGLHHTKRMVEAHNGFISGQNQPEGGMAFSFILPLEDVYNEIDKISPTDVIKGEIRQDHHVEAGNAQAKKPYTILIAEDNTDLMEFIRNLLDSQYNLLEALDGSKAWEMAQRGSPDLILSDVLMPGMSGFELCKRVKDHPELSHIPVILITAKSTINDQVEGLEQGADAYICKPFHVDFLLLTIKNLFMYRDRLREYYSTPQPEPGNKAPVPIALSQHDQKMMNKLTSILERELSNPELNVDQIGKDLGFSRTVFYRKIRGLMDMSPIDFISSFRLRKAAEMMQEGSASLTEISDKTGFSSYSYFSKAFKKHFGVSPRVYQKNHCPC